MAFVFLVVCAATACGLLGAYEIEVCDAGVPEFGLQFCAPAALSVCLARGFKREQNDTYCDN
jgi:hypothetical protein